MTIKRARKILGKLSKNMSDSQVQENIDSARMLASFAVEQIMKMTPEERKKLSNKTK